MNPELIKVLTNSYEYYLQSLTQTPPQVFKDTIDQIINYFSMESSSPENPVNLGKFGSHNSEDVDIFVVIDSNNYSSEMCQYIRMFLKEILYKIEHKEKAADLDVINDPEAFELIRNSVYDIQFIDVEDGKVSWAEKGNEQEINNAIFHTFKLHLVNYDVSTKELKTCPVTEEVVEDVAIKAMKTSRALLTYVSRTSYRDDVKYLLKEGTFLERINWIRSTIEDDGFLQNITNFNKNISKEDILKDITFSCIQLRMLVGNYEVPYTKMDAVFTMPEFYPLLLKKEHTVDDIEKLNVLIAVTLDACQELVTYDENETVMFNDDFYAYDLKHETPIDGDRLRDIIDEIGKGEYSVERKSN